VEITGGELEHPVELLVRRPGNAEVLRLPSFRESPTRFSRGLDALTEPVSVAFACGKARSPWLPVELHEVAVWRAWLVTSCCSV